MKKLIMICLVLVMLLTTGVMPRGVYADDEEGLQYGDWREWLSEDEWKQISRELSREAGSQADLLVTIDSFNNFVRTHFTTKGVTTNKR